MLFVLIPLYKIIKRIENTVNDEELKEYFGEIDKKSKIQAPLSAEFLPKLGQKESDT